MDMQQDIDRAEQARSIIDHPLFIEAFEELELAYIEAWRSSNQNEQDNRERLYVALNLLGAVRLHLEGVIAGGALARADLDAFVTKKDFQLN